MFCTQCGKNNWYYLSLISLAKNKDYYQCLECDKIQIQDIEVVKEKTFSDLSIEQKLKDIYNDIQKEIKNNLNEEKLKKVVNDFMSKLPKISHKIELDSKSLSFKVSFDK